MPVKNGCEKKPVAARYEHPVAECKKAAPPL
jgi:hypothetical protein